MNPFSSHLSFSSLVELAERRDTSSAQAVSHLAHAETCPTCAAELAYLRRTLELMRSDVGEQVPAHLSAFARAAYRARHAASRREASTSGRSFGAHSLRRIAAHLTFDSLTATPAYGVRGARHHAAAARQLVFNAEAFDIDLRIKPEEDAFVIAGQLLGECLGGGEARLSGADTSLIVPLNETCEFLFPIVGRGTFTLLIQHGGDELKVTGLQIE